MNSVELLEERLNNLALKTKSSLKERVLNKLNIQAKKELKELSLLDKKFKNCEKKLNNTLFNIENIDEYLAKRTNKKENNEE